ncbi:hypothetical protein [Bartonella sp. AC134YNZD]|uniref:hypothetical protein n=1 Tax=Bartonella sp. AC134YNZD TaxID=3243446 RepID=UPI0035CF43B1
MKIQSIQEQHSKISFKVSEELEDSKTSSQHLKTFIKSFEEAEEHKNKFVRLFIKVEEQLLIQEQAQKPLNLVFV